MMVGKARKSGMKVLYSNDQIVAI